MARLIALSQRHLIWTNAPNYDSIRRVEYHTLLGIFKGFMGKESEKLVGSIAREGGWNEVCGFLLQRILAIIYGALARSEHGK
jgi:hypothetical protein